MFRKILWLLLTLQPLVSAAQTAIRGRVLDKSTQKALPGATVQFLGAKTGTVSDAEGGFGLSSPRKYSYFVVRFIGLGADTIAIEGKTEFEVLLEDRSLDAVSVESRRETFFVDDKATQKTQIVGEAEFEKAACCNLSESFETNPAVDLALSDAVTAIRQVQMLGLPSAYAQLTQESMPYGRGLSSGLGLALIPGTWVESMQVSKGTGSVANGYESIAGQINFELRKPFDSDRLFVNFYGNNQSRYESNLHIRHDLSRKASSVLLLHADMTRGRFDMNGDGFLDMPLSQQLNAINRWQFVLPKKWEAQLGLKALSDDRLTGHEDFGRGDRYRIEMSSTRQEIWGKLGKKFADNSVKSFGSQYSYQNMELKNQFGNRNYSGRQQTFYTNLIYQSIIGTTTHKFRTGMSFMADSYHERLDSLGLESQKRTFERQELVSGVFGEYTYSPGDHFGLVAGLRGDYHNLFGLLATPRLHIRYSPKAGTTFRAAAGKGYRTANFLMENMGVLISSRRLVLPGSGAYPFLQEQAWNFGVNALQEWELLGRSGTISAEYYHTVFGRQVVADLDKSASELHFYDLRGSSFSHSMQIDLTWEAAKNLDLRLSYRYLDVRMTLAEKLLEKPLVAKHRAFMNLAYAIKSWKMDATLNWIGPKRLPAHLGGSEFGQYSPGFLLAHGQITREWLSGKLDTYLGIENALNFRQTALLVNPQSPFGVGFDGSLGWGPAMGRMVYAGLRFRIK